MSTVLLVVIGASALALPYVIAPAVARLRFRHRKEPLMLTVDRAKVPLQAAEAMRRRVGVLRDLGYESVGVARLEIVPREARFVELLIHGGSKHTALVTAVMTLAGDEPQELVHCYVAYRARWGDGKEVRTSNRPDLPFFGGLRGVKRLRCPMVRDVRVLHRIHRWSSEGQSRETPVLPARGRKFSLIADSIATWVQMQALRGVLVPAGGRGLFKLSWRSACGYAWKRMWPVSTAWRARERRKIRDALHALGIRLDAAGEVPADRGGAAAA